MSPAATNQSAMWVRSTKRRCCCWGLVWVSHWAMAPLRQRESQRRQWLWLVVVGSWRRPARLLAYVLLGVIWLRSRCLGSREWVVGPFSSLMSWECKCGTAKCIHMCIFYDIYFVQINIFISMCIFVSLQITMRHWPQGTISMILSPTINWCCLFSAGYRETQNHNIICCSCYYSKLLFSFKNNKTYPCICF